MTSADPPTLLLRYDEQLRGLFEVGQAISIDCDGPLIRAVFAGGHGFVTYRELGSSSEPALAELVQRTVAYFRDQTEVREFEWKTRGHDHADSTLIGLLLQHGLMAQEAETIMIGEAALLARDVPYPAGVSIRRIGLAADGSGATAAQVTADVSRMLAMQQEVFGRPAPQDCDAFAAQIIGRPAEIEAWIAQADGHVVGTGRLEIVPGTDFAGLWGGATRADWRGRGIYRALTAARARSAVAKGVRYLHSDSTEFSRPILQRSGFLPVSTTTPYLWFRDPGGECC